MLSSINRLDEKNLAYDDHIIILADFSEISINDLIVTHTEAYVLIVA